MAIDNLNFSNETGQQKFGELPGELPKDRQDAIIDQQHAEGNVMNRRIDELNAEKNRLVSEGYTTSERTEVQSNRITGLELQARMAQKMGDEAEAERINNEITQLQREKFETSDANVKQALKDLMNLLPSLMVYDSRSIANAPRYDEEMIKKMAILLNESVAYASSDPASPRDRIMLRLSDAGNEKAIIYECNPKSSYLFIWGNLSYDSWVNNPK